MSPGMPLFACRFNECRIQEGYLQKLRHKTPYLEHLFRTPDLRYRWPFTGVIWAVRPEVRKNVSKRDWKFPASHPPRPCWDYGEFWRLRLIFSSEIEVFKWDWKFQARLLFSRFGPSGYRATPFRDSIAEGLSHAFCLVFIWYRSSVAEIPLLSEGGYRCSRNDYRINSFRGRSLYL